MSATPPSLRRVISDRMLFLLVVGDILGAGIYVLIGSMAAEVEGLLWVGFAAAFAIAGASAASYGELVVRFPGAAGSALYAERAFGRPLLTFLVGFAVAVSSVSTAATTARAFAATYLVEFVEAPVVPVAVAVVAVLALVAVWGIETSVRANVVLTAVEVGGLVVVIVAAGVGWGAGEADLTRLVEGEAAPGALLAATALAFFAFIGFEDAVHLSEEVRSVRRYPAVLLGAVGLTALVYLLVALGSVALVEPATLATSDGPLLEVVDASPLQVPPRVFAAVALMAVSNTCLFGLVAASRLLYGMAGTGAVPPVFGRVLERRRTPWAATVTVAAGAALLAATGAVAELAATAVVLILVVLVMVNLAAIATRPSAAQGFRLPVVVPMFAVAAAAGILTHQLLTQDAAGWWRLGLVSAVGAATAGLAGRRHG